jgi:pyridoxal phosphate enzyme (YggS family)
VSNIAQNLDNVKRRIREACVRAGRNEGEVKLVVVTKAATIEQIQEAITLGCLDLGENRAQQLKKVVDDINAWLQASHLQKNINWHMIGHLQRNKVRGILPMVTMIHSVDTLRLAEEISSAAANLGTKARILIEVNAGGEAQKFGIPIGAATHFAEQISTLPNLELLGLMTMAPLTDNHDIIRSCFSRTRELFIEMRGERIVGSQFRELSMGMSNDFEIAIEEGATMLRIGSAIFSA